MATGEVGIAVYLICIKELISPPDIFLKGVCHAKYACSAVDVQACVH